MIRAIGKNDRRTEQQIQEHYDIERELADRLRNAPKSERRTLYSDLYDELFQRVPHHTQLTRKQSPQWRRRAIAFQMNVLRGFLDEGTSFLEVGPGDCALAFHVAEHVKNVVAVDVSENITNSSDSPDNFELILSDGSSIPVPENSIHVIYSNQLMEHLHPDDAFDQLGNILRALVPGGVYLCITPNRLSGPHDISKYFDTEATGFHLKEYTVSELSALFRKVGFTKLRMSIGAKGRYVQIPVFPAVWCEKVLELIPRRLRHKLATNKVVANLISVRLSGVKPGSANNDAQ